MNTPALIRHQFSLQYIVPHSHIGQASALTNPPLLRPSLRDCHQELRPGSAPLITHSCLFCSTSAQDASNALLELQQLQQSIQQQQQEWQPQQLKFTSNIAPLEGVAAVAGQQLPPLARYEPSQAAPGAGSHGAQKVVSQPVYQPQQSEKQSTPPAGKGFYPELREVCKAKLLAAQTGRKIFLDMGAHDGSSIPEFIGDNIGADPAPHPSRALRVLSFLHGFARSRS